jgi:hypothetical protein
MIRGVVIYSSSVFVTSDLFSIRLACTSLEACVLGEIRQRSPQGLTDPARSTSIQINPRTPRVRRDRVLKKSRGSWAIPSTARCALRRSRVVRESAQRPDATGKVTDFCRSTGIAPRSTRWTARPRYCCQQRLRPMRRDVMSAPFPALRCDVSAVSFETSCIRLASIILDWPLKKCDGSPAYPRTDMKGQQETSLRASAHTIFQQMKGYRTCLLSLGPYPRAAQTPRYPRGNTTRFSPDDEFRIQIVF